jgi:hypothetical protein
MVKEVVRPHIDNVRHSPSSDPRHLTAGSRHVRMLSLGWGESRAATSLLTVAWDGHADRLPRPAAEYDRIGCKPAVERLR